MLSLPIMIGRWRGCKNKKELSLEMRNVGHNQHLE